MNHNRRIISCIIYIVFGVILMVLGVLEVVDAFWSGMGGALIAMGAVRAIQVNELCDQCFLRIGMPSIGIADWNGCRNPGFEGTQYSGQMGWRCFNSHWFRSCGSSEIIISD